MFSAATGAAAPAAARGPAFTALLFAVQLGQLDAVRALLEAGANVNDTLPDGTSALVLATQNGHWELGAFLIDQGADVNAGKQGWTALHQIVAHPPDEHRLPAAAGRQRQHEQTDLVKKLLAKRRERQRDDDPGLPRRLSQPAEPRRRHAVPAGGQERRHRADEGAARGRRRIR